MNEQEFCDRRRFKRLRREVNIIYMLPLLFVNDKWKCKTVDIGGGGICIQSKKTLKNDSVIALQLEMKLANGKKNVLRTIGQVVWHKKDSDNTYLIGIKFVIEDDSVKRINDFIEKSCEEQCE